VERSAVLFVALVKKIPSIDKGSPHRWKATAGNH
jgi:hypothetical protein